MKKFLLNFAWVTLVALLCCASATVHAAPADKEFLPWAKQAYAVLDEEGTLTFRYDSFMLHVLAPNKRYNIEDHYYDHGSGDELLPEWSGSKVKKVVILSAFAEYSPTSTAYWFYKLRNLTTITGMENLNTSQVTDMEGMFEFCDQLTSLEVSRFDTRKVLDFDIMFKDCQKIESLDVSRFNTSEAIDMGGMFANCLKIKSLDLWHFDTRKVERMSCLFYMCVALKTIYCRDSWTCRSSEDMFKNCFSLRGGYSL